MHVPAPTLKLAVLLCTSSQVFSCPLCSFVCFSQWRLPCRLHLLDLCMQIPAYVEKCPPALLKSWMATQQPLPRSLFSSDATFSDRIMFGSFNPTSANSAKCCFGYTGAEPKFRLEAKEVFTGDSNHSSSHAQSMCHDVSTPDQAMQSPAHSLACHLDTSCLVCIQVPRFGQC